MRGVYALYLTVFEHISQLPEKLAINRERASHN